MAKKQILTNKEIEKDIITALKNPPDSSEDSYRKTGIIVPIVTLAVIAITAYVDPEFILWELVSFIALAFLYIIFLIFRQRIKIKKVSINDYSVTTEIVHSTSKEHFTVRRGKYYVKRVDNYTLRFENGKTWRIPKDNYLWSVERPMSDFAIYESTHREDTMIVVTKKDSGDIVMAYHTDFFEYRD